MLNTASWCKPPSVTVCYFLCLFLVQLASVFPGAFCLLMRWWLVGVPGFNGRSMPAAWMSRENPLLLCLCLELLSKRVGLELLFPYMFDGVGQWNHWAWRLLENEFNFFHNYKAALYLFIHFWSWSVKLGALLVFMETSSSLILSVFLFFTVLISVFYCFLLWIYSSFSSFLT